METHNDAFNKLFSPKKIIFLCILFLQSLFFSYSSAENGLPIVYSITPQSIQQGLTTTVKVAGENLPTIVGIDNNDVYAVFVKREKDQRSITIQLTAKSDALGPRNLILINSYGIQTTFPFQITPSGSPKIDDVTPSTAFPGDTILVRLIGQNLTKPFITSLSEDVLVISSRPSNDGSVVDITISVNPNAQPNVYPILVSTPYGQTETSITILESNSSVSELDSFIVDPYSPDINSIEFDSQNRTITLKGSMFDPVPVNNIVTLLDNNDGTSIGIQIEPVFSSNNEIILNLPEDITSDSISFAVSSADGRSSNIESINLNESQTSISTTGEDTSNIEIETSNSNEQANNNSNSDMLSTNQTTTSINHIDISTTTNDDLQQAETTATMHPQESSQTSNVTESETTIQQTDLIANNTTDKSSGLLNESLSVSSDAANIIRNFQNVSQYILGDFQSQPKEEEIVKSTISEIKNPEVLISTIEEDKKIKNQADLLMIALEEAKQDKELSKTVKRAEELKAQITELEEKLQTEKNKNKPNQRKLEEYQKLLASASAESKSQTFELLNNLLKLKPQLKNLLSQKPFDLAAVQPNIPEDAVILQYVPTEEGLIIFVVDNKNLKTRINKYISKDILSREVQDYRNILEKEVEKITNTGRVTPITSWKPNKSKTYKDEILPLKSKTVFLYNALIQPVEKDIASKKVIAIIANGWLRYLPFQSLAKPTKDGDLDFLISDKSVVYLDSVIAVSKKEQRPITGMSIVTIFANPDGTLSGANKEAEIISKLYTKSSTSLVQRPFSISLINQLAEKSDILHLATHGYLDGTNIDSSYLILGKKVIPPVFKDGKKITNQKVIKEKLLLKDIYDLNLKGNKLVVLSGCDTGKLGNLANEPDDIVGSLASAFRVAGSNTILASLWKAHDEATKLLMQSFYTNLKSGVNKAESLRRAILTVKEDPKYSHPLFWSLFNLIGDWR